MMYVNFIIIVVIVSEKKNMRYYFHTVPCTIYTFRPEFLSSVYEVLQLYLKVR
jgi:hypothetical protein